MLTISWCRSAPLFCSFRSLVQQLLCRTFLVVVELCNFFCRPMLLAHFRRSRIQNLVPKSSCSTLTTKLTKDSFCSYCGTRHAAPNYPLHCPSCSNITYANPVPVSIVLVPVEIDNKIGLLVGKRNIEPQKGKFAFFGGFVEMEDAMNAGVRELKEESGIEINRARLLPFWFTSTEPNPSRVLLFSDRKSVV